jgi:hypothetical protein
MALAATIAIAIQAAAYANPSVGLTAAHRTPTTAVEPRSPKAWSSPPRPGGRADPNSLRDLGDGHERPPADPPEERAERGVVRSARLGCLRIGAPTWLARTRLEWARMLLTLRGAGDMERAQELLRQALTTARELGLGNVERRAMALLG